MSDRDRLAFERRAFLRGFAVTSAGLLVPRRTISIPRPRPEWQVISGYGTIVSERYIVAYGDLETWPFSMLAAPSPCLGLLFKEPKQWKPRPLAGQDKRTDKA